MEVIKKSNILLAPLPLGLQMELQLEPVARQVAQSCALAVHSSVAGIT